MKIESEKEPLISSVQEMPEPLPFYEMQGSGKNKLVLIHGFGLNRRTWYDIAPLLAVHSTLYMMDMIGFGDSPTPHQWPYTMEAQADVLYDFILRNKIFKVVLAGHSYGGGVALILLHKMMENGIADRVQKLILISPAAYPQPLPFFAAFPCIPFIGRAFLALVSANFQIKVTLIKICKNKKTVTRERIHRYVGNIGTPSHRHALIQTAKHIIPRESDKLVKEIEKIQHKTLLIYGENDTVILRENLERLSGSLLDVTTHKLNTCGHLPQEEYPEYTAWLISRFL